MSQSQEDVTKAIFHLANRLKHIPPNLAEQLLQEFEPSISAVEKELSEHRKALSDAFEVAAHWLHDQLGESFHFERSQILLDGDTVFDVYDSATCRPPTNKPIGQIIVKSSKDVIGDAPALFQSLSKVRIVTPSNIKWLCDEISSSPYWSRHKFVLNVVLTAPTIFDFLHRALVLKPQEYNIQGRLQWHKLNDLLPKGWPQLDRWEFQNAALQNLRSKEQRQEFESATWWWRCRVIDGISDPTQWVVDQYVSNVPTKVIAQKIFGPLGQSTDSISGNRLIYSCQKALEKRSTRMITS